MRSTSRATNKFSIVWLIVCPSVTRRARVVKLVDIVAIKGVAVVVGMSLLSAGHWCWVDEAVVVVRLMRLVTKSCT